VHMLVSLDIPIALAPHAFLHRDVGFSQGMVDAVADHDGRLVCDLPLLAEGALWLQVEGFGSGDQGRGAIDGLKSYGGRLAVGRHCFP
jgi:hypothetical protein